MMVPGIGKTVALMVFLLLILDLIFDITFVAVGYLLFGGD